MTHDRSTPLVAANTHVSAALLSLGKRQSGISPSDFPTACQSGCTTVLTTITTCDANITSAQACICTSDNVASIQSCVNCIVSSGNVSSAVEAEGVSLISCEYLSFYISTLPIYLSSSPEFQLLIINLNIAFNSECAGQGVSSLTVGSATATSAAATGSSSSSPLKSPASANSATVGMVGLASLAAVGFAVTWL